MIDTGALKNPGREYAPIQIVHDFRFVPLNVTDDYTELNDMDPAAQLNAVTARLKALADCGYGGIVVNVNFENYLKDEAAFAFLDKAVAAAAGLGLRVWLYDEQYYPSGSAGGLTLKDHPEYEGQGMVCITKDVTAADVAVRLPSPHGHSELQYACAVSLKNGTPDFAEQIDLSDKKDIAGGFCWDCESGSWRVYCFFLRVLYENTYLPASLRASRRYPNITDPRAIRRFVKLTYQKYEKYLHTPLGDRVEAVFTDEPTIMHYTPYPADRVGASPTKYASLSVYDKPDLDIPIYPYIPWGPDFETGFSARYGYRLRDALPELFESGPHTETYRMDFYAFVSERTKSAFLDTIQRYTRSQHMLLGGHFYGEEDFDRQPFIYGDLLRLIGSMDIPGCDLLFSKADKLRYSVALRLASSAAHIYERPHTMIEASNMMDADQNLTLAELCLAISIMYAHGIDTVLSYYGENILPPEQRKIFAEYCARLGKVLSAGKNRINTLLYYPYPQLCAARQPMGITADQAYCDRFGLAKLSERLLKQQICFDFANDEFLLQCKWSDRRLRTPAGEVIERIVFPEIDFLTPQIADFAKKANEHGVSVAFSGIPRQIRELAFTPDFIGHSDGHIANTASDALLRKYEPGVLLSHKSADRYEMYLLVNTVDCALALELELGDGAGGPVTLFDPLTCETSRPEAAVANGRLSVKFEIQAMGCVILFVEIR